jgi:hypothetical protein
VLLAAATEAAMLMLMLSHTSKRVTLCRVAAGSPGVCDCCTACVPAAPLAPRSPSF